MLFDGILSVVAVIVTETDTSSDCIPVSQSVFGYGVISAGAKGIATEYAPYRQNGSYDKASFTVCLKGIGRASRREPTSGIRFQS